VTTLLLINPAAGRGRAGELASRARSACQSAWRDVACLETDAPGAAVPMVRDAVESGVERVIVLGGDGTLHEAANGLLTARVERRPPISVVPAGTGNDFAKLIGTVGLDPARAVAALVRGRIRPLDVGGRGEFS
jgi:diacylglycerol kinase family enzyme